MRRGFLAAITIVIPIGLTITQELGAQARPDSLVKPAVLDSPPPGTRFEKDSATAGADSIARADSAAVVAAIRKHLGARTHEITGVRLFPRLGLRAGEGG